MNDKQMELFLPGLLVLIISAIFIFMVLPRMGTVVLAVVCALALSGVLVHHYSMFSSEYRLSTWQNGLSTYAPFILIGVSIFIVMGVAVSLFTGDSVVETIQAPIQTLQSGITASLNAMPTAGTATNPVTSVLNSVIKNNKSLIPTLGYRASNV
jgi:peptidoglycan/LPS O-acetylase OafA/YrhL